MQTSFISGTDNSSYALFSDGGARGNPGPSAAGWIIFAPDGKLADFGAKYLGETTNNSAEYQALLNGLNNLRKLTDPKNISVKCHLDSELAVKQLRGEYKIKNSDLKELHGQVQKLLLEFRTVEFVHVPRSQNHYADKLVNIVLDARQ